MKGKPVSMRGFRKKLKSAARSAGGSQALQALEAVEGHRRADLERAVAWHKGELEAVQRRIERARFREPSLAEAEGEKAQARILKRSLRKLEFALKNPRAPLKGVKRELLAERQAMLPREWQWDSRERQREVELMRLKSAIEAEIGEKNKELFNNQNNPRIKRDATDRVEKLREKLQEVELRLRLGENSPSVMERDLKLLDWAEERKAAQGFKARGFIAGKEHEKLLAEELKAPPEGREAPRTPGLKKFIEDLREEKDWPSQVLATELARARSVAGGIRKKEKQRRNMPRD